MSSWFAKMVRTQRKTTDYSVSLTHSFYSHPGTIFSIAFFNFAGVSVTKQMSATTRTVLDSVRTLVIKVISVALAWESIDLKQMGGFALLIIGMCLYNDVLIRPCFTRVVSGTQNDEYQDETQRPLRRGQSPANGENTATSP